MLMIPIQRNAQVLSVVLLLVSPPAFAATYYGDVAPIMAERCVMCHSGEGAPLGLKLDTLAGLLVGSRRGQVVKTGDAAGSELVKRIRGDSLPRMPMTGPPYLSDEQIAAITAWINAGMPRGERAAAEPQATTPAPNPGAITYTQVAPIFLKRCVKCHTDGGVMGNPPEGLRLNTLEQMRNSGERVALIPGNAGASEIVRRIRGQARPRMPFDGPPWLTPEEIELIARWIDAGAPDAQGQPSPVPVGRRLRMHGQLTGMWELDGTPLIVGPGARIKKRIGVGRQVRVEGSVGPRGEVIVSRIKKRD